MYRLKQLLQNYKESELANGGVLALEKPVEFLKQTKRKESGTELILQANIKEEEKPDGNSLRVSVTLDEEHGELVASSCSCSAFQEDGYACPHTVAIQVAWLEECLGREALAESPLKKVLQKKTGLRDPFLPGILRKTTSGLTALAVQGRAVLPLLSAEGIRAGSLHLHLYQSSVGSDFYELRIGEKRTYIVKDGYVFFRGFASGNQLTFGKNLSFRADRRLLDAPGQRLLDFLQGLYRESDEHRGKSMLYSGAGSSTCRYIGLFGRDLDAMMETVGVDGIYSSDGKRLVFDPETHTLPVSLKKEVYGAALRLPSAEIFGRTGNWLYLLDGERIYRVSREGGTAEGLLKAAGSQKELYISEKDLPVICREVLGNTKNVLDISGQNLELADYLPVKPEFVFYLDLPQDDLIDCQVKARYGTAQYLLVPAGMELTGAALQAQESGDTQSRAGRPGRRAKAESAGSRNVSWQRMWRPGEEPEEQQDGAGQGNPGTERGDQRSYSDQDGLGADKPEFREVVRDPACEQELVLHLMQVFHAYNSETGSFVFQGDDTEMYRFLTGVLPGLAELGEIFISDRMKRLQVRRVSNVSVGVSVESGLLDLELTAEGFELEELAQILSSYQKKKRFYRLKDGSFVTVEEEQERVLSALADCIRGTKKPADGEWKIPLFRALYLDAMLKDREHVQCNGSREYRRLLGQMREAQNGIQEVPDSLREIMRAYQADGFRWLKTLKAHGFGGILADDMGLGKTLQVLAFLLSEKEEGKTGAALRTLIVTPASLVYNWKQEIARYTPQLRVRLIVGNAEERKRMILEGSDRLALPGEIVVTNAVDFDDELADGFERTEMAAMPEPETGTGKRTGRRKRGQAVNETGETSPETADLPEIWITSYDLLKRDIQWYEGITFANEVLDEAQYIKNQNTHASKTVRLIQSGFRLALTGTPIENRLSDLWSIFDYLMPGFLFTYARFRSELELPAVNDQDEEAMEKLRRMVQPFILRRLKKEVLKELPDKLEEEVAVSLEGEQRRLYDAHVQRLKLYLEKQSDEEFASGKLEILAELTKLRQLCCGPELLLEGYQGPNGKLETCMELVHQAVDGGHKVLIFSQFTSMLDGLEKQLAKEGIADYRIDGSVSKEKRMELVEAFDQDDTPVFCISLKAGGTGLNLTAADIVIHYDPWWNLAAQNQATDRTHRIGQEHVVTVYQLIAAGTIEEKIVHLQKSKYQLAEDVLSGEGISSIVIDREQVMELLR